MKSLEFVSKLHVFPLKQLFLQICQSGSVWVCKELKLHSFIVAKSELIDCILIIRLRPFVKHIFNPKNYQIIRLTQWYIWERNVRLVPAAIQWALFQKVNLCASKILACFRSLFFRDGYFGYSKICLGCKKDVHKRWK